MHPKWWLGSLLALAGAIYFAILLRDSIRSGEVAKFTGGGFAGFIIDARADATPDARWLKYISRDDRPIRFWIAVVSRGLIAFVALLLAIWFFVVSVTSPT